MHERRNFHALCLLNIHGSFESPLQTQLDCSTETFWKTNIKDIYHRERQKGIKNEFVEEHEFVVLEQQIKIH